MEKPNTEHTLKWSVPGLMAMFGVPVLAYLIGASITQSLSAAGNHNADAMTLGFAFGALMVRIGAMVYFVMSVYRVFFLGPSTSTPHWMVKRG